MPVKHKPTKEIKCLCGKNTVVDVKPATTYVELTRFLCTCGKIYHIRDYYNGVITYMLVSKEEDNKYRELCKDKIMKHEITLDISFNDMCAWQSFLNGKGTDTDEVVKTFTAKFGDKGEGNIEVDIKICDSKDGSPYIDAVMFQDGHEVGVLEVSDILAGEYPFMQFLKDNYIVIVPDAIEAAKEGQRKYRAIEQWLQKISDDKLVQVHTEVIKDKSIDRMKLIEDLLEECSDEGYETLNELYTMSQGNIHFNASNNSPQCFTDKDPEGEK